MTIITDPAATEARRAALARYYEHTVLTSEREFICSSAAQCMASAVQPTTDFNEGQLPHVGPHYDTTLEICTSGSKYPVSPLDQSYRP